jgi:hypothetical protein
MDLDRILLLLAAASPLLFLPFAILTRARVRRWLGALVGGVACALLNVAWDMLAYRTHWWHYPGTTTGHALWRYYVPVWFVFGAGFGLIGWRVIRRFGGRGLLGFLAAFATYGTTRDYVTSSTIAKDILVFGNGVGPWIADAASWFSLAATTQAVMWLVSGAPADDALAKRF